MRHTGIQQKRTGPLLLLLLFASYLLCVGLQVGSGCSGEGYCPTALCVRGLQSFFSLWLLQLWHHSCLYLPVLPSSEAQLRNLRSHVTAPSCNIYISMPS